jgi:SpoVK/Ycf46/Vps4 family AAA+-type ATPase
MSRASCARAGSPEVLAARLSSATHAQPAPAWPHPAANAIRDLPPELLRKGRFDEIFFVDLPDHAVRAEIFRMHLGKRRATASEGFSGAEIEQTIVSAAYAAYAGKCVVDEARLLTELAATRPLSVLMAEHVRALREWARTRTVTAD